MLSSLHTGPDFPLLVGFWCLYLGPDLPSSGGPLVPVFGTRSSFFRWASGVWIRDQIFPLLVSLWCLDSGPDLPCSVGFWCLHQGPDIPSSGGSSGGPLVPAFGTLSSLIWWASGPRSLPYPTTLLLAREGKIKKTKRQHPRLLWPHLA